jgi:hypothetical protein
MEVLFQIGTNAIGQRCRAVLCLKTLGMELCTLCSLPRGAALNLVVMILFVKKLACLRR